MLQIFPFGSKEKHYALLAVLVACMAWTGVDNLQVQLGRVGEFSNIPMEELVEWIKAKTPQGDIKNEDFIKPYIYIYKFFYFIFFAC